LAIALRVRKASLVSFLDCSHVSHSLPNPSNPQPDSISGCEESSDRVFPIQFCPFVKKAANNL